ncbi:MAG TPA: hypothetical protein VHA33_26370 [Candidatus Angelobacter sp.]|nr:hypothetical protein [Candidatus Angelobacter sp.]
MPLVADKRFREFDSLIQRQPSSLVHASLIGRFFAGNPLNTGSSIILGYGHMGCCSLLAIQQVLDVDSRTLHGLDYGYYPNYPETVRLGLFRRFIEVQKCV